MAVVLKRLDAYTVVKGVKWSLELWLGFVVTIKLSDAMFSGKNPQQRSLMFWIQTGYYLITFVAAGVILGGWR